MNTRLLLVSLLVVLMLTISGIIFIKSRENFFEKLNPSSKDNLKLRLEVLGCNQKHSLQNNTACFSCNNFNLCAKYSNFGNIISLGPFFLTGNYTQEDNYNLNTLGFFRKLQCDAGTGVCISDIVYDPENNLFMSDNADMLELIRKNLPECKGPSNMLICGNILLETSQQVMHVNGILFNEQVDIVDE